MSRTQGKPVLGAVLGVALGLIVTLILQQGGIVPPTRLVLFGIVALCAGGGSLALATSFRSRGFISVQAIAFLIAVFALTGIPAMSARGDATGGCTLSATSTSHGVVTPADTSVATPFEIDRAGTVGWDLTTPRIFAHGTITGALEVGGFRIQVWDLSGDNPLLETSKHGVETISDDFQKLEDITGIPFAGVYHVYGYLHADEGSCATDVYVRIPPSNLFSGPVLIGLWGALGFIGLLFAVYVVQIRSGRWQPPTA